MLSLFSNGIAAHSGTRIERYEAGTLSSPPAFEEAVAPRSMVRTYNA